MTFWQRIVAVIPCRSADAASTLAPQVDRALKTALFASTALGLLLIAALAFVLISRRSSAAEIPDFRPAVSPWVMVVWCTVMLTIAGGLFWVGYVPYLNAAVAPADAYEIQATSQKGSWSFAYPSGKVSVNRLVVPRQRPIRLVMSSKDDVHSLFLPQFRLQQVAIPGRFTSMWFEATQTKTMPIQCAQDCPAGSAQSVGTISVFEPEQFAQWLALKDKPKRSLTSAPKGIAP